MFLYLLLFLFNLNFIYSSIQIINSHENVNVTITCYFNRTKFKQISIINKYSDNIILWYKNEIEVIGVNSISNNKKKYFINQLNLYTYQLIILNVQLESSGLYKCQNFTAKEENFFQLNVIVPPSHLHLISSSPMPVDNGTTILFNCTSERVYPNPIFEWYKNDKLIQRSIGNQTDSILFSSSSILTLLLTPADHNHILRCQVSNEASIHKTNIEIKLNILFKPIINIIINERELTDTLTIIENTLEIVHCRILSNPSIIENIQWFQNDQLIIGENDEQLQINFTGIKKLSCRAKNIIGETESSININILYKPKLSLIDNIILNQGEKLHLKCLINSNPLCYRIRWLFNEKELLIQSCIKHNLTEYIIENIDRFHAGTYTCEVTNLINTTFEKSYDGISRISTDVHVQYAPFILNSYKKLAIIENHDIVTECFVDAYPKADIIWLGTFGQRLNSFTEEIFYNNTVISSKLHLPSSYSSTFGLYRCIAKNNFGQHEFSIDFQRPSIPDPPNQLQAINITYNSFILNWYPGYNGGFEQIFHIILSSNYTEERQTNLNFIQFNDLNEKTRYMIKIRSKNHIGFSDYSTNLIVLTKECLFSLEEFPLIRQAYFIMNNHRLHFQLNSIQQTTLLSNDQLCIQYYNNYYMSSCISLNSIELFNNEFEINIEQINIRLKLCLINQTDICSKSISIPINNNNQLSNDSFELILILIGSILGLCIVISLIGLFICIHQRKCKKIKSKNSSTDTLKTNNTDNCHSILPVRVSDTNSCLYYPTNETRTLYFNDETIGIYSIQGEKTSICFDSGIPSTISNNSDSIGSQILSSSDIYDRSDGEYLVNGKISSYTIGKNNHFNIPIHGRISSEDESELSTSIKDHKEKKLVYEVVV